MVYIVDTHTLVWYLTGSKQLSKKAERILKKPKEFLKSLKFKLLFQQLSWLN